MWQKVRLKFLLSEPLQYGANEEGVEYSEDLPRYIRITDFDEEGRLREDTKKSLEIEKANSYYLEKGDVLFARSGATVGKTFQFKNTEEPACFAGYLIKARTERVKLHSDFLYYFTKSNEYTNWKNEIFSQATIQNIGANKYANLLVPTPSVEIQGKVISFLDQKCALIDALIEKKKKLVELKKEERTALINQAVTKGLDPNIPMKDTGIEWLGEIPAHWEGKRLKYVSEINIKSLGENTAPDYEFKYVEISSVGTGELIEEPKCMSFENAPTRARRIVHMGDTIISTVRTYLKAISYIEEDSENLIVSTGFAVVTPIEAVLLPKYLFYILLSEKFIDTVCSLSKGVSYPAINSFELAEISIWYPSLDEQQLILNHIESAFVNYNQFIKNLERQIELLKEYKTTLISEAVTGEIIPA